jgi:YidC/Oxa1 family membrane protein insertase
MGQVFHSLLDGLGWFLARVYDLIPNYGVAIIVLTLFIRILLLPLAIKQIRSMQAMQRLQPKIKELQRKYKGNRPKINEEMMKLYQEHGYNPLSGCLPLILQFPVLIALFAVLSFPKGLTHIPHSDPNPIVGTPQDSRLYVDIINQQTKFLGVNLVCSPREAGQQVKINDALVKAVPDLKQARTDKLDCGHGAAVRIPYYVLLALMVATTFFQQRQMQKASPAGAGQQQQQMLARIMPIFFGFIGLGFPTGLILYWTTTNAVQIVQQHFMLVRKAGAPDADLPPPKPARARSGFMQNLRTRALEAQQQRTAATGKPSSGTPRRRPPSSSGGAKRPPGAPRRPSSSSGGGSGSTGGSKGTSRGGTSGSGRPQGSTGGANPKPGTPSKGSSSGGGQNGGDRKKRRKR